VSQVLIDRTLKGALAELSQFDPDEPVEASSARPRGNNSREGKGTVEKLKSDDFRNVATVVVRKIHDSLACRGHSVPTGVRCAPAPTQGPLAPEALPSFLATTGPCASPVASMPL
jgi:hypothetical protein